MSLIAAWVLVVNVWAFLLFGYDKRQARRGADRVSERGLLNVALLGGGVGAKLGQRYFRHKTRKEPFRTMLNLMVGVNLIAAVGIGGYLATGGRFDLSGLSLGSGERTAPQSMPRRFGPGAGDGF